MSAGQILYDEYDLSDAPQEAAQIEPGMLAAFVRYARTAGAANVDEAERTEALQELRSFAPALEAAGVFEVFDLHDPKLRRLLQTPHRGPARAA